MGGEETGVGLFLKDSAQGREVPAWGVRKRTRYRKQKPQSQTGRGLASREGILEDRVREEEKEFAKRGGVLAVWGSSLSHGAEPNH